MVGTVWFIIGGHLLDTLIFTNIYGDAYVHIYLEHTVLFAFLAHGW